MPADIFVRFLRMLGREVLFVCGSDEHGVPILLSAMKEGKVPRQIVDYYHELNRRAFQQMHIHFDIYHRTSDALHHRTAQEFFVRLWRKGVLEVREVEQFYDVQAGMFLADRYVRGTCPRCGYQHAYGDQCEKCGSALSAEELINPHSAITGAVPERRTSVHWFFRLDQLEPWLKEWIESKEGLWKQNVLGQCYSWLRAGMRPRAITRDLPWGVPVPEEVGREAGVDVGGKVLYVWFEAPIGYISATKAFAEQHGMDWRPWWMDERTAIIHFIGKDNIVFHALLFPAMLKSHGEFTLPYQVPANEFLNLEGDKISTSRNWAVWCHEFASELGEWIEPLRFFLTRIMPETRDSEFTWSEFAERVNNELVATLGNFIHRTMVLAGRLSPVVVGRVVAEREEVAIVRQKTQEWVEALSGFEFRRALEAVLAVAQIGNQFLSREQPWQAPPARGREVVAVACELVAVCSLMMYPFMPETAEKVMTRLAVSGGELERFVGGGSVLGGRQVEVGEVEPPFRRIGREAISAQVQKLKQVSTMAKPHTQQINQKEETAPTQITIDEFGRVDLRIGIIKEAERITGSHKLWRLAVDTGDRVRQLVVGLGDAYTAEELVGMRIVVVCNLQPRKIMGYLSEGMLLAVEDGHGRVCPLTVKGEVTAGSRIS